MVKDYDVTGHERILKKAQPSNQFREKYKTFRHLKIKTIPSLEGWKSKELNPFSITPFLNHLNKTRPQYSDALFVLSNFSDVYHSPYQK